MSLFNRYDDWLEEKKHARVPDDFASRVLAAVEAHPDGAFAGRGYRKVFLVLWNTRSFRVGVSTLACLVCALRMFQVVTLFLPH
jgi:hypothetical protein